MAFAPAFAVVQTFQADKTSYKKGDMIKFSGTTDAAHANSMVSIKILNKNGEFVMLHGGRSDSDGMLVFTPIDLSMEKYYSKFAQKGVYNATAFYNEEPKYAGKFTLFDYSTDGSPVSPSAADLMNVKSTTTPTTPTTPAAPTTPTQPPLQPSTPTAPEPEPPKAEEPEPVPPEKPKTVIPGFPDPTKDPQTYVDRYNTEFAFKVWFNKYFPGESIYDVVGLPDPADAPATIPGFPDPAVDPQTYVDRYENDPAFAQWFNKYFPGKTIYDVVGLPEPQPIVGVCGEGTVLQNGVCIVEQKSGGGCLVATAAYGTELAPQVQSLREQSPLFKEATRVALTPLISSLSILNYADVDSEQELVGYSAGIILLNIGMYFALPAFAILQIRKRFA